MSPSVGLGRVDNGNGEQRISANSALQLAFSLVHSTNLIVRVAKEARLVGIFRISHTRIKFLLVGVNDWRWIQTAANLSLIQISQEQGINREIS